jgi:tripartite-type tricarboxylate transporter receptor subunit TctC
MLRRQLAALPLGLLAAPALARGAWPTRPVRVVVAFPPGGLSDFVRRMIAQVFQDAIGGSFFVDNGGGAGGTPGGAERRAFGPGWLQPRDRGAFHAHHRPDPVALARP